MPYHIRRRQDEYCVVKGHRDDPGETVKCHPTRRKALAHMAALYVHVEDVQKAVERILASGGISTYKQEEEDGQWIDRWITVSSREIWDLQEEEFTKEAMDYDVARAYRTGNFPELRLFHVRGFKLGMCDDMCRVGEWAVEQGSWHKTRFAQSMKEIVEKNKGRWKVSKGFYSVKAAGLCPSCDIGLTVGLLNYALGVRCPQCKEYHARVNKLRRLRHLAAVTYDLTITDVPAVVDTAVAAYSYQTKPTKE